MRTFGPTPLYSDLYNYVMRTNKNLNFVLDIMTSMLKATDIINIALRFREYYNMHMVHFTNTIHQE